MITAGLAIDQGRDVFAVPGSIFNKNSEGPNNLISYGGARAISCADELLEEYKERYIFTKTDDAPKEVIPQKSQNVSFGGLSKEEEDIVKLLLDGPLHADELNRLLGQSASELTTTLSMLEFSGKIQRTSGNIYKLKI